MTSIVYIEGAIRCVESVSKGTSIPELERNLAALFKSYDCTPTFTVKQTNRRLCDYNQVADISSGHVVTLVAKCAIRGGKGGFGTNLRSGKASRQPKKQTGTDSRSYSKDLKTGIKISDLTRLKKAQELLEEQQGDKQKEHDELRRKREKLQSAIDYYESILKGKPHTQERFPDTKFLEDVDTLMLDLRDRMEVALGSSESDEYESDWVSSDEQEAKPVNEAATTSAPRFATFFDTNDESDESDEER